MLRKILADDDLSIPYSTIDFYDNIKIIDVPTIYTTYELLFDEYDMPVVEEVGTDDEGNPIYQQVMQEITHEIDVDNIGVEASYYDVRNPLCFDLIIGGQLYSWSKKEGAIHIGVDDGYIGLVKYTPYKLNGKVYANTKKIITPKFTPLRLQNGLLTVNGVANPDAQFVNAISGKMEVLSDVLLVRGDISKSPYFPPPEVDVYDG